MNIQPVSLAPQPSAGFHHVQFYDDENPLMHTVANYFAAALRAGRPAVGILTKAHQELLLSRLDALGLAPASLGGTLKLTLLDAPATLGRLMRNGAPDVAAFDAVIGTLIQNLLVLVPGATVCAYGEMVDLLCKSGEHGSAVALEALWNSLIAQRPMTLLCSYNLGSFSSADHQEHFAQVCGQHDVVLPANDVHLCAGASTQALLEVSQLQQQARALESEVAYRRRLESGLRQALKERRAAEAAVRAREEELRDFFEAAAEPLHAVGADGRIEWANEAELQMLGYTADEYVGRHFSEFYVDRDAAADVFRRLAANETLHNQEAQMRHKDGSIRDVLVTSNVYRRDGRFIHTRCFTRDITRRKRAERALAEAVRSRDDFIAIASHELRNPLHAIHLQLLGAGEVNNRGGPDAAAQVDAVLSRASLQVTRLGRLLDNLLDVSRLTAGRLQLEPQCCDLVALARAVVDRHRGEAPQLSFEADPDDIRGSWDPLRLDQILTNLLINAIRYGKGLPVRIVLTANGDRVTLRVEDQGEGISEADQARIFERFERAIANHKPGGMGLGLWITRQIVDAMGGSIAVTSTVGQDSGSVFEVSLPRHPV